MGLGLALLVLLFGSEYRANLFNNAEPNSYAHAIRRAAPSVVSIHTASTVAVSLNPLLEDPLFKNFFRIPATADNQGLTTSLGSGVIVAPDGYILTNFHVVSGADRIQVVLYDGRIADAEIVGADPETDIAVLHISYIDLPNIVISDSNNAKVGDIVLAIGVIPPKNSRSQKWNFLIHYMKEIPDEKITIY
jgi:S1-C subfamily serine protease